MHPPSSSPGGKSTAVLSRSHSFPCVVPTLACARLSGVSLPSKHLCHYAPHKHPPEEMHGREHNFTCSEVVLHADSLATLCAMDNRHMPGQPAYPCVTVVAVQGWIHKVAAHVSCF